MFFSSLLSSYFVFLFRVFTLLPTFPIVSCSLVSHIFPCFLSSSYSPFCLLSLLSLLHSLHLPSGSYSPTLLMSLPFPYFSPFSSLLFFPFPHLRLAHSVRASWPLSFCLQTYDYRRSKPTELQSGPLSPPPRVSHSPSFCCSPSAASPWFPSHERE